MENREGRLRGRGRGRGLIRGGWALFSFYGS